MTHYVVNTQKEQQLLLNRLGYQSFEQLFEAAGVKEQLPELLPLEKGVTEFEALDAMKRMAMANKVYPTIFRGAGAYRHYIPSVVKHLSSREEFVTAYTPYQAEISQGILQSIFEYQTMMCELTGMEVSNASVYDGATAVAEAAGMCVERKKNKVLIAQSVNPQYSKTARTYFQYAKVQIEEIPVQHGVVDVTGLSAYLQDDVAAVIVQYPNYYGCIEDLAAIKEALGAIKLIVVCNPIALALLKAPGKLGADIVVGEGQPLGMPLSFGGPYLGFMCAKEELVRKLPGRIVGQTVDEDGKRAYTLTLQAREQHIRREKASSSICSNEALCALTAGVYLSAMGPEGLQEVAQACYNNAHYLQEQLGTIGFTLSHQQPFFHEFVTELPMDAKRLLTQLDAHDVLGGYPLADNRMLWCATEVNTKAEIDRMITIIKEVSA